MEYLIMRHLRKWRHFAKIETADYQCVSQCSTVFRK